MERTLLIIKPDGVRKNVIGDILNRVERAGLKIKSLQMLRVDRNTAGRFYAVHRQKPFYQSLLNYMTSGPVIPVALEGENAVKRLRTIIGATNPSDAEEGTIRKLYGESIEVNTVHGSDSVENGNIETSFFFSASELEMTNEDK